MTKYCFLPFFILSLLSLLPHIDLVISGQVFLCTPEFDLLDEGGPAAWGRQSERSEFELAR